METSTKVPLPTNEEDIPEMGTLEAKFLEKQLQPGIQFSKQQANKKQPSTPQSQNQPEAKKKKKSKKKKQIPAVVHVPIPQTPSTSAKKKVSFSPRVVSTVAYTYSKQEYDRTPIMGIFNHFCDCCMEGIEGARFHCRLCENFDMCQTCFVAQGAAHIHGQAAFTCPELDELEENEGDEGDAEELDDFTNFLASLAQGGVDDEEDEEDGSLDDLAFRFTEDNDDLIEREESSVRLADENGPLERITSAEASRLETEEKDTPIKMLFPKVAASSSSVPTAKPKAHKKKQPNPGPQENVSQDAKPKKKPKKASAAPLPQGPSAATQTVGSPVSMKKKKAASTQGTQSVDLQKKGSDGPTSSPKAKANKELQVGSTNATDPAISKKLTEKNASPKKPSPSGKQPSPSKAQSSPSKAQPSPSKVQPSPSKVQPSPSKKRARTDGAVPKLKKQKLVSDSKSG